MHLSAQLSHVGTPMLLYPPPLFVRYTYIISYIVYPSLTLWRWLKSIPGSTTHDDQYLTRECRQLMYMVV